MAHPTNEQRGYGCALLLELQEIRRSNEYGQPVGGAADHMTSKTKRTLAIIDELAGTPDMRATWPRLLVPIDAYDFALRCLSKEEPSYKSALVFQMDYRFRR